MKRGLLAFLLIMHASSSFAALSGGGLTDVYGNGLTTSQALTHNPLDVQNTPDGSLSGTITATDTASTTVTAFNNQIWYTGTPTAGSVYAIALPSIQQIAVQVGGSGTQTLQTELSFDGGTSWTAFAIRQYGSSQLATSFTSPFGGALNTAGATNVRVRSITTTTAPITVRFNYTANQGSVYLSSAARAADGLGNLISSSQGNLYRADGSTYRYFNAAGTTVLKTGSGLLFSVCITSLVNGSSIALYDNTAGSGTIIIGPQVVTGGLGLGAYVLTPTCLYLGGVVFSTGLTAVVAGTGTYTVTWK